MSQTDKEDPESTGNSQAESGQGGISGAFRPLFKELVKAGIVAFDTVSEKTSVVAKQFNDLLEEARSEALKTPSPGSGQGETSKKTRGSKPEKRRTKKDEAGE
ncbi:hypothetical protein [uncultured Nitrospira sp.]|uniref:hypothetical protein n=1 Tax=uncultured Nitrospira sp. TaxID=157176 RepID=UPI00313FFBC6